MRNGLMTRVYADRLPGLFARDFERLFDDAFTKPAALAPTFAVPADIEETETHYLLSIDAPGLRKEDIKVEVLEDELRISGERLAKTEADKKTTRHLSERRYGRFERTFRFGELGDLEKIEAQFTDGVLHIAVPKKEAAKPRRIDVKIA